MHSYFSLFSASDSQQRLKIIVIIFSQLLYVYLALFAAHRSKANETRVRL